MTTLEHTKTGLDPVALQRLRDQIRRDVDDERYDGAVVIVARGGHVGLHEAIGFADRAAGREARPDDVFRIFSTTKAFTNALVLNAVDRGLLALTTPVAEVIPEFLGSDRFRGIHKPRVTIAHLLTHRAALVPTPTPLPYDQLGDLTAVIAAIGELDLIGEPGMRVQYSPALAHALLGEAVRRVHGAASFREVLDRELLAPLQTAGTRLGAPAAWADRLVPAVARFPAGGWLGPEDIEVLNTAIHEDAEMPWVGCVATAEDIWRFAEMVRRGGDLDGARILSPAILDRATRNHTGDAPNELYKMLYTAMGWDVPPASIGLGFMLRGDGIFVTPFGTLSSPRTHGNFGAGSSLFWIDAERDLVFVCLTAGVMEEAANLQRFQRLSDLAQSAAITSTSR
jgi:CubicO group peptidase (beta-lactamase class C family)